jgi:hypothetical protein
MAIQNAWMKIQQWMDNIVHARLGEPVEFHPWASGEGYGSEGQPDPNRPVLVTWGILDMPGPQVIGMGQAFGANTRILEQDVWLSIQEVNIGSLANYVTYDRVYFPDRDLWFEINYPAPSATRRPRYYLTRLQPGSPT